MFLPTDNVGIDRVWSPTAVGSAAAAAAEHAPVVVLHGYDANFGKIARPVRASERSGARVTIVTEGGRGGVTGKVPDGAYRGASQGDVLVVGDNFGVGVARPLASSALKDAGFQVILGSSFADSFKRCAVNGAVLALEAPELVDALQTAFGNSALTVRTGWAIELDFARAVVRVVRTGLPRIPEAIQARTLGEFPVTPVGMPAQELFVAGGLDAWLLARAAGSAAPGTTAHQ